MICCTLGMWGFWYKQALNPLVIPQPSELLFFLILKKKKNNASLFESHVLFSQVQHALVMWQKCICVSTVFLKQCETSLIEVIEVVPCLQCVTAAFFFLLNAG